ncbi:molybdopterin-synthase adenylyltransferase MoeB [Volucribacter amazonae]|uniref:Molybdopterin-synthase adenylyltransferase n=1 Tax=Volucribacter amazonae TaxID=256731 RepID=A0A9X4SH57_9PAST|nr:molybdopterin-synthase adenylyltransferase MoeB [Volucribacter amazonae]MDG6894075.1 molybdopterin-synthase adenylyltransferase MoeB [Volucribacter amazonae]
MSILSEQEELRYNRQIILPAIDFTGQEQLKTSHMLIVGLGGLGCAASQYLATAGIGTLTLLDFDKVSLSNLQRQVLHNDSRINMAKVDSAKLSLTALNPHLTIHSINRQLDESELSALICQVDMVLDCTDNLNSRQLLDRCCQQHKIPLISGAAIRMEGQVSVFTYQPNTPTYQDISRLFGESPLSCVESGVLSPIVGIVGAIQAFEAIKVRLNIGKNLAGRLLLIDGMKMQFKEITIPV